MSKPLLAFGAFVLTAFLMYGATSALGGSLKSTPYQSRDATADQTLDRLTNGAGKGILDGVVLKVKQKAVQAGGNPLNAAAHDAYLNVYLDKLNALDDTTRAGAGPGYEFIFQYIYPRVHELRKNIVTAVTNNTVAVVTNDANARYPGCNTDNIYLPNGQVWAACNVGAATSWDGVSNVSECALRDATPTRDLNTSCSDKLPWIGGYYQWGNDTISFSPRIGDTGLSAAQGDVLTRWG
jgi:hypothetical protein